MSLTGITALTQYNYKGRHNKMKNVIQVPGRKFLTMKQYRTTQHNPTQTKKTIKKVSKESEVSVVKEKKIRFYKVNKKEVTHRLRQYVLQMKMEKQMYFWTVSLPQGTTDDTGYLLLNKWLTRLRQERMIKEYLWISERQENGTIHYHMVINRKMDVQKANRYMRASIMHCINSSEINWSRESAIKYNGVDIAKNRKTRRVINFAKEKSQKSLSNYLTKYITKNDTEFTRLAWHYRENIQIL
jgi:hypothetical protein